MRRLALCVVVLFPTSCSLMFVNGPPPGQRNVEPSECTTSQGWPAFDVILSLLEAARTGYAVTRTDADYKGSTLSRPSDIAIGATLMALTAISAGVGFNRVSECNDAIDGSGHLGAPVRRHVVAPPRYTPPAAEPSVEDETPQPAGAHPAPAAAPPAPPARPAQQQQTDTE
jgi:hypothetical protein